MLGVTKRTYSFTLLPLVLIRHGETHHNQYKQWSGWHDARLSPKG